jgi:hypothetical protein
MRSLQFKISGFRKIGGNHFYETLEIIVGYNRMAYSSHISIYKQIPVLSIKLNGNGMAMLWSRDESTSAF